MCLLSVVRGRPMSDPPWVRSRHSPRARWWQVLTVAAMALTVLTATSQVASAQIPVRDDRAETDQTTERAVRAQRAADYGAANAAANEVEQSVAVVDRTTGALVAENNGGQVFNSESILKLFTAAFYLTESEGPPESWLVDDLRTMITTSDNGIQTDLWDYEIIPTIAERYDLADTSNGYAASPESWGSDRTTATDQALFLYRMSVDPEVGPLLMTWMAATAPTAADGFDQSFGLAALTGGHGSKQGWSDPDWSPANLHSVGWTGRYFVAILQTSPTATYATMRATSTTTAKSLAEVVVASVDKSSTASARHVNRGEFGRLIRHSFENSGIGQGLGIGIAVVDAKDSRDC